MGQERQQLLAQRQAYHQSVLDRFGLEARMTAQVTDAEVTDLADDDIMAESSQVV